MSQTGLLAVVSVLHLPGIALVVVLIRALVRADREQPEPQPVERRQPGDPPGGWRWRRRPRPGGDAPPRRGSRASRART